MRVGQHINLARRKYSGIGLLPYQALYKSLIIAKRAVRMSSKEYPLKVRNMDHGAPP